jgi:hemerythrin-like domain-containing protein
MSRPLVSSRRKLLSAVATVGAAGLILPAGLRSVGAAEPAPPPAAGAGAGPEVAPIEDLMREHGVLRRVMLVHDHVAGQLDAGREVPLPPVARAASVIRHFIQDYHEKLEEDHIFPRFQKAKKLTDLVKVLLEQHQAGRRLIDTVSQLAGRAALEGAQPRRDLAEALRQFNRMYRPHAAREDTVLFPGLHTIVTAKEYDEMGDVFEDKEKDLFGEGGFEKIVDEVAAIEKAFGLDDLASFTPKP